MLSLNLKVDAELDKILSDFRSASSTDRSVIIVIKDEVMTGFSGPIPFTSDLSADLTKVRACLDGAALQVAYIVVRVSSMQLVLVTYVSDSAPPREKMLYSSGRVTALKAIALSGTVSLHVSQVENILPQMFQLHKSDADLNELMTVSELMRARIAEMEVAPRPVILPGLETNLSVESAEQMRHFTEGLVDAVAFSVNADGIMPEEKVAGGCSDPLKTVVELIPADHPRYLILNYKLSGASKGEPVMVYVCPAVCKPKEKLLYASSKAAFLKHTASHNIKFAKRVEVGGREEFIQVLHDAFTDWSSVCTQETASLPVSMSTKQRGPRMLI